MVAEHPITPSLVLHLLCTLVYKSVPSLLPLHWLGHCHIHSWIQTAARTVAQRHLFAKGMWDPKCAPQHPSLGTTTIGTGFLSPHYISAVTSDLPQGPAACVVCTA